LKLEGASGRRLPDVGSRKAIKKIAKRRPLKPIKKKGGAMKKIVIEHNGYGRTCKG